MMSLRLPRRASRHADRITVDTGLLSGEPCIRGLRITVAHIVRLVAAGWTTDEILAEFPFLDAEDIHQALLYAADATEVVTIQLREPA